MSPRPRPPSPRPPTRAETGRRGEELAASHLRRRGFAILDRNVRSRYGEIDLIACDGRVLAFVEVKTTRARRAGRPRPPFERVGAAQRARVRRLALSWLLSRPRAPARPPE